MVPSITLILAAALLGLWLEWLVLRVVNRRDLLADVNERSSHERPTPTMGGIVIVILVLGYMSYLTWSVGTPAGYALVSGAAIAGVGLWDDLSPLSARLRLFVQFAAVGLLLFGLPVALSIWQLALVALAWVWLINLYNFMDGIDGLAAVQCILFCLGVQLFGFGHPLWINDVIWVTAGASLAFLAFNWPPARIFMGDVGSAFLGLLLGFIALVCISSGSLPLVVVLLLLTGFWFDATYTLCVRMLTGQRFTQAHRSHLYQRLADQLGHGLTTLLFIAFNLGWLWPLAYLAQNDVGGYTMSSPLAVLCAAAPLGILCWRYSAGLRSSLE